MNRHTIRSTSGASRPPSRMQTPGSNGRGQHGGPRAPASVASTSQTPVSSSNQGLDGASASPEDDLESSISAALSKRKSREECDEDYLKLSSHGVKRLKAKAAVCAAEYGVQEDELVKFVEVRSIFVLHAFIHALQLGDISSMLLNLKASLLQQSPAALPNKFNLMKVTLESKTFDVGLSI